MLVFLLQGHLISGHEVRPSWSSLFEGVPCWRGQQQMLQIRCEQLCRLCSVRLRSAAHADRALILVPGACRRWCRACCCRGAFAAAESLALCWSYLWGKGAAVPLRVSVPLLRIRPGRWVP